MIDFREYMPTVPNEPFYAKVNGMIRIVEYNTQFGFFKFTDCTHPMANCNCNPYDIEEWEYVDKSKMNDLLFHKSWIGKKIRESEGEIILNKLNPTALKSFLLEIKNVFNKK